jgi:predicted alpha/beta-hydrolase family hydrolase
MMAESCPVEMIAETDCDPPVRGFLHNSRATERATLVLTHGAGSNCQAPLLVAVAETLAEAGLRVLLCNLPFRQERPQGPPRPGDAARDRAGLKNAVEAARKFFSGQIFLGGHSYGGRQATMLAAGDPSVADGLLLLSYPLHPPRKPAQLRTQHLPNLRTPALFVHGTRDPFGSIEEMQAALKLVSARTLLMPVPGGHDLAFIQGKRPDWIAELPREILSFFPPG